MEQLYTRWGKEIDCEHVLQEYPRPLLQRESYVNLNGYWDYAFTAKFRRPEAYAGKILVPFSPESALSGVGRQLRPDEYLWYRRMLPIEWDKLKAGYRLILHFGAVDQACRVYVNGQEAARHTGGYLPFSADITAYCHDAESGGQNELVLAVRDVSDTSYHARGKQKLKRGGMFYTAQSGIWQTVWMEYVPAVFIEEVLTEADLGAGAVRILVKSQNDVPVKIQVTEPSLYLEDSDTSVDRVADSTVIAEESGLSNHEIMIPLPLIRAWTCETPYLYYFTVTMGEDRVKSYFALRTFTIEKDGKGIPRICLNGRVQFQNGVLDQGYWPDGLYTAPADEALIFDIREMKKLGFNMLRKHIKIEPQRWYYHCDRLGMIVWQDMVNGGTSYKHWFVTYAATLISRKRFKMKDTCLPLLSRSHKEGRREFVREMKETIRLLKGHPSIAAWVIFNEGWGQFNAQEMTRIARSCDNSRLIDQASGWFDQNGGDMQSIHHYFFSLRFAPEEERVSVLSEYGGYSLRVAGHSAYEKLYGYGTYQNQESLNEAFYKRLQKMGENIPDGLCAGVYTQLSDVEEEVNGIFTYDREVCKIDKIPLLPDT
ncbi:MAG: glycoside hydrolase family 2 [Ruminococcus sp.]|nr:glycoside hydrolase family 2 [Ruminococcus sp.]